MTKQEIRTDWESIERDYRAGVLSIREVGKLHDVSDTAIRKRAKVRHWDRREIEKAPVELISTPDIDQYESSGFVYVLMIDSGLERFFKIGLAKHFSNRFDSHQCSSPFPIYVACCYFTRSMRVEERELHSIYDSKRVRGEWFRLSPTDLAHISKRSLLINHG